MHPTLTCGNPMTRNSAYASGPAPTPVPPDCLQGVILQTVSTLQDIEAKLGQILQKIQPAENEAIGTPSIVPPHGVLNGVNMARNAASRIIDLCIVIDNLI